jgi:hypothetical protein
MFRFLSVVAVGFRVYPDAKSRKRAILIASLVALLAGCGGGGGTKGVAPAQTVTGPGFTFAAPAEWSVARVGRSVTAKRGEGPELASVTVLTLRKLYQPALFTRAATELDRVSDQLAAKLGGKVIARRTLIVAGLRARQYDLAYERDGTGLVDRITYVLRGKSEYYLLCRWPADKGVSAACAQLETSFRIR